MSAARWVVIGTAIVAAATAFHLLMSPTDADRALSVPDETRAGGANPGGAPQDEIDAASRDAMREFLRESAAGEAGSGPDERRHD